MRTTALFLLSVPLLLATSGCATFATNIAGEFECRAMGKSPSAECQPASRIDADATESLAQSDTHPYLSHRAGIVSGDTERSHERTIRIVIPAHVDSAGILHEESVIWAVAEKSDWAARLRRKSGDAASGFARSVARAMKAAQHQREIPLAQIDGAKSEDLDTQIPDDPFAIASPLALPSTAREAVAGAHAPAVEGFDMPPPLPHVRIPRHTDSKAAPVYPSAEAIDAAKAAKDPE